MAATNKPNVVSIKDLPTVASLAELLDPDHKQQIAAQARRTATGDLVLEAAIPAGTANPPWSAASR
jgi:hypothetical protein